jgi:hypothetical protein
VPDPSQADGHASRSAEQVEGADKLGAVPGLNKSARFCVSHGESKPIGQKVFARVLQRMPDNKEPI